MKTFLKVLRIIAETVLCIAVAVSVAVTPLLFCIDKTILTDTNYAKRIVTDEYIDDMLKNIKEALDEEASIISIDTDKVISCIDRDDLTARCNKAVTNLANELLYGSQIDDVTYENEKVYKEVEIFLSDYADENNIFLTHDDVDAMYKDVCLIIAYCINIAGSGIASRLPSIASFLGIVYGRWWFAATAAASLLLLILLNLKRLHSAFRKFAFSAFIGSLAIFIPALLWKNYDFSSRLILGISPLRTFVTTIVYDFDNTLYRYSLYVLITAAVLFVASVIVYEAVTLKKEKSLNESASDSAKELIEAANDSAKELNEAASDKEKKNN